jgi:hypothetical protein
MAEGVPCIVFVGCGQKEIVVGFRAMYPDTKDD